MRARPFGPWTNTGRRWDGAATAERACGCDRRGGHDRLRGGRPRLQSQQTPFRDSRRADARRVDAAPSLTAFWVAPGYLQGLDFLLRAPRITPRRHFFVPTLSTTNPQNRPHFSPPKPNILCPSP